MSETSTEEIAFSPQQESRLATIITRVMREGAVVTVSVHRTLVLDSEGFVRADGKGSYGTCSGHHPDFRGTRTIASPPTSRLVVCRYWPRI